MGMFSYEYEEEDSVNYKREMIKAHARIQTQFLEQIAIKMGCTKNDLRDISKEAVNKWS